MTNDNGCPVDIDGHHFNVPVHMLGLVDSTTSWGRGLEQQEHGFKYQVATAGMAERADEILHAAAAQHIHKP